jgi:hypothetical protein
MIVVTLACMWVALGKCTGSHNLFQEENHYKLKYDLAPCYSNNFSDIHVVHIIKHGCKLKYAHNPYLILIEPKWTIPCKIAVHKVH